jgi:hypothetical protein
VFDEVYGNIHPADLEFENHYRPWEKMATLAETQQSDRILIRAYFYPKLEPQRHAKSYSNWGAVLGSFRRTEMVPGRRRKRYFCGLPTSEEFNILEAARGLGVRYNLNMHPQFLMNLHAASPGLNSRTKTFEGIFPTNFGLRVTDRVSPSVMARFLTDAVTAVNADEAFAAAKIRGRANSLLGVRFN